MVQLEDVGTQTIEELKKSQTLSVLCSSVDVEASVRVCQAVISTKGVLVHVGDYVKYCVSTPSYAEVNICSYL